jgi:hypothetical protein
MDTFTVPLHLFTAHPARRNTEVVLAQGVKLGEGFLLDVVLGDDPFACAAMADVVLLAELVEEVLAADAEFCFQA